jgi:hypothetical protein
VLEGRVNSDDRNDEDTTFERFRSAWMAYQDLQPAAPAKPIHYLSAIADHTDEARRLAAIELKAARAAWLEQRSTDT